MRSQVVHKSPPSPVSETFRPSILRTIESTPGTRSNIAPIAPHQSCFNRLSALSTAPTARILLPIVFTRVIIAQIISECGDSCLTALGRGHINAQVSEIAHKGANPLLGVQLPLLFFLVEPSLGLCVQLLLIPHLASAALPPGAAFVTELGCAAARHVVASEAELDYHSTARTPLPAVLLEQVIDHGAIVLTVTRGVPWVGGLLAVCAEETVASWTGHLAIKCLH